MTPTERAHLPCIGQERADLVVAGCAILEAILDIWPAERLGVADRGIREGILRSLMAARRASRRASLSACGPKGERAADSGPRVKTAQGRARSARPAGSSGSSTILMSSAPRPKAIAVRAAYKLIELDERFGCSRARSGWSTSASRRAAGAQVVRQRAPSAAVVGIDLLPTEPIEGVDDPADGLHGRRGAGARWRRRSAGRPTWCCPTWRRTRSATADRPFAHHGAGRGRRSNSRSRRWRPGGAFVAKVLAGGADAELVAQLKRHFPRSSTPSRRRAARARPNGTSWRRDSRGGSGLGRGLTGVGAELMEFPAPPASGNPSPHTPNPPFCTPRPRLGDRRLQRVVADRALQHLVADHEGRRAVGADRAGES